MYFFHRHSLQRGVAPSLILGLALFVWYTTNALYQSQLGDGPTPRPRLTLPMALRHYPAESSLLLVAVALQGALVLACNLHSVPEVLSSHPMRLSSKN